MVAGDVEVEINSARAFHCAMHDGTNDEIELTVNPSGWDNFTISGRFFQAADNSQTYRRFADCKDDTPSDGWALYFGTGGAKTKLIAESYDAGSTTATIISNDIQKGVWHSLSMVKDGSTLTFYIDNTLVGTDATAGMSTSSQNIFLGSKNGANFTRIAIADVQLHDIAFDTTQVSDYHSGNLVETGLKHRWKFEDDYKDSVGEADGTNTGTYLTIIDDKISAKVADQRVGASDNWMTFNPGKIQVGTIEVEE